MFWKKTKAKLKENTATNDFSQFYQEGEVLLKKIASIMALETYNTYQLEDLLEQISIWNTQTLTKTSVDVERIRKSMDEARAKVQLLLDKIQQKEIFSKKMNDIEDFLQSLDLQLQQFAKDIPKITNIAELENINTRLSKNKESITINDEIIQDRGTIVLDREDTIKLERITSIKENLTKKIVVIEKSMLEKRSQLDTATRTESINEERKKMFTWADSYENKLKKFKERIQNLYATIEEVEHLSKILEYQTQVNSLYNDVNNSLRPPNFKNPEVQAQTNSIAKKLSVYFEQLITEIQELKAFLIGKTIDIIADKRANRLERLILRTKRHVSKVFVEILHSWEEPILTWLKSLNDTEPLRLQEPATIAFSMERLNTFKINNLHAYLQDAMVRFTTFEWETYPDLQNQLLQRFLEVEKSL